MIDYLIVVFVSALISAVLLYASVRFAIRSRRVPFTHFRNKRKSRPIEEAASNADVQIFKAATSHKYAGGCDHIHTHSDNDPIDNHTCHCSVCKGVSGQDGTHVMFFNYGDLVVDNLEGLNRQPFNDQNPDGPLELCTCSTCGTPIMLDDKQGRIRVIVPNLMGFDTESLPPATYHAFYDASTGAPAPDDGRPVYDGLRPDFVWPASA